MQIQHSTPYRALNPDAEFEQSLAHCAHLGPTTWPSPRQQAPLLYENIGGGSEQHAELIGQEACAAPAINLQSVVNFFDAVLDLGAHTVHPLVQLSYQSASPERFVTTNLAMSRGSLDA